MSQNSLHFLKPHSIFIRPLTMSSKRPTHSLSSVLKQQYISFIATLLTLLEGTSIVLTKFYAWVLSNADWNTDDFF